MTNIFGSEMEWVTTPLQDPASSSVSSKNIMTIDQYSVHYSIVQAVAYLQEGTYCLLRYTGTIVVFPENPVTIKAEALKLSYAVVLTKILKNYLLDPI